jgi:hypothetical protein
MHGELFDADGFMVGYSFFMCVIGASETVDANSAVEYAAVVVTDELQWFVVFEAVAGLHVNNSG